MCTFWASANLFVYVGKLLSDRENAGKLWAFDLNLVKMQGCCLVGSSAAGTHRGSCENGCCEFAAVVGQTQACYLPISIYRGINTACLREPHDGQCLVLEVERPWERPVSLAKVPEFGRSSPCVATASPMGMRVPNHCTSSLTCCLG